MSVFSLEFQKGRERSPDTRADFAEVAIALVNDEWFVMPPWASARQAIAARC